MGIGCVYGANYVSQFVCLQGRRHLGPKVFFMREGRSVYQTGWFPYPPERRPKSIYFDTPNDEFAVAKSDAKFKVAKEGDLYQLTPLF